ncbi:MAG: serine/threonine-protein kinase [Planctomycetota bacterium]
MARPPQSRAHDEDDDARAAREAAVFDFVADFLDDVGPDGAAAPPLTSYLARYPGHEEAIALEYLRLIGATEHASGPGVPEPPAARPDDGERRLGHNRLVRELGRGGQGAVGLAEDERLGRKVALKLLTTPFITVERRGRFRREAEVIARIDHPGLAGVHDADLDAEVPWIAMRYVEGQDLGAALDVARAERERAMAGSKLAPLVPLIPRTRSELARVLAFFERAARALHAAHEEVVVHRDITPGIIRVAAPGVPVVLDFGLARGVDPPGGREAALTRDGEVFGTPAYMAPEQFAGRADELDRRADVWSLGVTLYEALTGARPFAGASPHALARAILEQPVPDPRERNPVLTMDVRVVIESALERDRARRYPSALELAEDLRRIREFEPVRARPAGPALRLRRWCRREPAWAATIGVSAIALVVGLAASLVSNQRKNALITEKNSALDEKDAALVAKDAALAEKQRALDLATARRYAGLVPEFLARSPAAALALGLKAVALRDEWWTREALYGPLEELTLERRLVMSEDAERGGRIWQAATFAGGAQLVACSVGPNVRVFDLASGALLASRTLTGAATEARRLAVIDGGRAVLVGTDDGVLWRLTLPGLEEEWQREVTVAAGTGPSAPARAAARTDPVQWITPLPRGNEAGAASPEEALVVTSEGALVVLGVADGAERLRIAAPRRSAGEARALLIDGLPVAITAPRSRAGRPLIQGDVARVHSLLDGALLAELPAGGPIQRMDAAMDASGCARVALGSRAGAVVAFTLRRAGAGVDVSPNPAASATLGAPVEALTLSEGATLIALNRGGDACVQVLDDAGGLTPLTGVGAGGAFGVCAFEGRVVAACADNRLRVVARAAPGAVSAQHLEEWLTDEVLWCPESRRLVSFGIARHLWVWRERPASAAFRAALPEGRRATAIARLVGALDAAVATTDGEVLTLPRVTDASAAHPEVWSSLVAHGGRALLVATPDGRRFATAGGDGAASVWTSDGALVAHIEPGAASGGLRRLDLAEDGAALAATTAEGALLLWTERGGARWAACAPDATALRIDRAGRRVAVGRGDGAVELYDVASGEALGELSDEALGGALDEAATAAPAPGARAPGALPRAPAGRAVRDLAYSSDGAELLVASQRDRLDLWDVATRTRVVTRAASPLPVTWTKALGGARFFAHGEGNYTGRIIALARGTDGSFASGAHSAQSEWELRHDLSITCIDASPDGALVGTASLDGAVHVYQAATGALVARYNRHAAPVLAFDFGPDGRIASVADDGMVALWPIDPVPPAKALMPRDLDLQERARVE